MLLISVSAVLGRNLGTEWGGGGGGGGGRREGDCAAVPSKHPGGPAGGGVLQSSSSWLRGAHFPRGDQGFAETA